MAEPTIPAGATIAAFIMTVISWYGMLRAGVQLVHDDIEGHRSVEQDIRNMLTDLEHQKTNLQSWKQYWYITEQTPDAVLLLLWGARRLNLINEKLIRMKSDLEKARVKLGRLAEIKNGDWARMSKMKRMSYTLSFIWTKKKFVQDLIDRLPKNMTVIREESDAGWIERGLEISHTTPYHAQVAHLLVQIAMQNMRDAEALRDCCRVAKDDVAIFLDLDLFDAFATVNEAQHVERIAEALHTGHLKLELLLREADRQKVELTRVVVERVFDEACPESRITDAFKAILSTLDRTLYFTCDASTMFCLSKFRRARDPCSTLHQSLREVLGDQDPPCYNTLTEQISSCTNSLSELSTARIAFELAQACLLFLRTTWIREICRCTVRCGVHPRASTTRYHHFGLDLAETPHLPPRWRHPDQQGAYVEGTSEHSWCKMIKSVWHGLIKPIRHLGLLLVEISLGTIVFPEMSDDSEGTAAVRRLHVLVEDGQTPWKWENISLRTVLKLVRQHFNDSAQIAGAIEYCLAGTFPSAPSDAEMEKHLRGFYFKVVKPLRDVYDVRIASSSSLWL